MNLLRLNMLAAMLVLACLAPLGGARASDEGCKIMLCLAYPKWDQIGECEATVRRALRRAARGHSLPRCNLASSSSATTALPVRTPPAGSNNEPVDIDVPTSAAVEEAVTVETCPVQYRIVEFVGGGESGFSEVRIACRYATRIAVSVDGRPWSNTFFDLNGDTRMQLCPAAVAAGLEPDERFVTDQASYASQYTANPDLFAIGGELLVPPTANAEPGC
jgi:hypothetical protein